MPTSRRFIRIAARGLPYEAQDVIAAIDNVHLLPLEPGPGLAWKQKWHRRLLWRDFTKKLAYANPGLKRVKLTRDYDLFFVVCTNWWDLFYVNAIDGLKDRCKITVCCIDELWASWIPKFKYWLEALNQFDLLFVAYQGTVKPLSEALGRPCHFLPSAVDVLRFTPYPNAPARSIDVYSMGRRWEGVHRALLSEASAGTMFYMYDTAVDGGDMRLQDSAQHRSLLANIAKRSRFFMVAPAKMGVPEETQGQIEIGYRYFEGAAAGAVMLGLAPDCDVYPKLFDWPDTVIPVNPDGSDILKTIRQLSADPQRLDDISRRNAIGALLRHDWAYRWEQVLQLAGLKSTAKLEARRKRLADLADLARNSR